jgi:hypothetical protein
MLLTRGFQLYGQKLAKTGPLEGYIFFFAMGAIYTENPYLCLPKNSGLKQDIYVSSSKNSRPAI